MNWSVIKHFSREEFDSPDEIGTGNLMDQKLIQILDDIRETINRPIIVTSGYRTPSHNIAVGGLPGSEHLVGCAADIGCRESALRFTILKMAIDLGIKRIGLAKTFIHLGTSLTHPSPNTWLY